MWVVTRHQFGFSAIVTQTSFCEGSSGDLARRRLFSQATWYNAFQPKTFLFPQIQYLIKKYPYITSIVHVRYTCKLSFKTFRNF